MLINLGRLLILCVWGFLLFNLFHPFPKPLQYFIDVALFFMVVMHGLQLVLLKATLPISYWQETKIFIFGLFELLAWQKSSRRTKINRVLGGMGYLPPSSSRVSLYHHDRENLCLINQICAS